MTVAAGEAKAGPYTGNDVATTFAFGFKVLADDDIRVVETLIVTGVDTDLILNTNYTVVRNVDQDNNPGGTITYRVGGVATALPSTKKLTIVGNYEYEQPTDLPNGGPWFAQVVENALDRITMLIKQLRERVDNTLQLSVSAPDGVNVTLPAPAATQLIGWDGTGTGLQNYDATGLVTAASYGTAVADIFNGTGAQTQFVLTNAPVALANLDVSIGGVTQLPGIDYTVSGTLLTFIVAPANGVKILARYMQALAQGTIDSAGVIYLRTTAEIAAGVTPANSSYLPGNWFRYGAIGNNTADDTAAARNASKLSGYSLPYNGQYKITGKIQIITDLTLVGENKQKTQILSAGFADYVIEIGDGVNRANCGVIERLYLQGAATNLGVIRIWQNNASNPPAYWSLRDLVFQSSPCPALVLTEMWDSWFENIDILGCVGPGVNPATAASVVITGNVQNSNNLYFKGLHIEGALCGALYLAAASPVYVVTGKIDNGFSGAQVAPAITLATGYGNGVFPSELNLDHFSINGVLGQYVVDMVGALKLGSNVAVLGGNSKNAAIYDHRAWFQLNSASWTASAALSYGPYIPALDLGSAFFGRALPFANAVTPAAVYSKIFPIRVVANVTTSANGAVVGNTISITTNATSANNDTYNNCYLVHNATGTQCAGQAGARRKIIQSFTTGVMTIQGTQAVTLDADWSIEFCGGHYTPIRADEVRLDPAMQLFAVVASGCTLTGPATYHAAPGADYGTTTVQLAGIAPSTDLTGLYLIDEATGEPFLIAYGSTAGSIIGVMYDRTVTLTNSIAHSFSVVAGYHANIKQNGGSYEWTFAGKKKTALIPALISAGFDIDNLPLWGGLTSGEPIGIPYSASMTMDVAEGKEFIITASNGVAFTVNAPLNLSPGDLIYLTIKNQTGGALGALTLNAIFKSPAWVQPGAFANRSVLWRYDGVNLVEMFRSAADVPS